ncbi:MAG: hypothetical protein GVY06_02365 [Alphaproteobacteria bacterium]|nr:hypothetical protein [Alphaproteobacteria bacterium]
MRDPTKTLWAGIVAAFFLVPGAVPQEATQLPGDHFDEGTQIPEPLVHIPFDGSLGNTGAFPAEPRMMDTSGELTEQEPEYVEGRFGEAMMFDGSSAVEIPMDVAVQGYPKLTVTAWVYTEPEWEDGAGLIASNDSFLALQLYGGQVWMTSGKHSAVQFTDSGTVPHRRWMFVAGVWNTETGAATLYTGMRSKTGELDLSTIRSPDRSVWLGAHTMPTGSIFRDVRLDDVRIYGDALSADQIREVHDGHGGGSREIGETEKNSGGSDETSVSGGYDPAVIAGGSGGFDPSDIGGRPDRGISPVEFPEDTRGDAPGGDGSAGGSATAESPASSQPPAGETDKAERKVIGWRISEDTVTSQITGSTGDLSRILELPPGEGLQRIGWTVGAPPINRPCRLKIGYGPGGWDVEAGTCPRGPATSREAELSSAYITTANTDPKTFRNVVDGLWVEGFQIDDEGEFQLSEKDVSKNKEGPGIFIDPPGLPAECPEASVATGVIGHFKRRNDKKGSTVITGIQLLCGKIEKIYAN